MKCSACGYEYVYKVKKVDDVVYYKSGKRKGEIKEVNRKELDISIGHSPFMELYFEKNVDTLVTKNISAEDYSWNPFIKVELLMCPDCGTIKGVY